MKNLVANLTLPLSFAMLIPTQVVGQSANTAEVAAAKPVHIRGATAIGEVFGDGEKIAAVAIEYDKNIQPSKLSPSAFSVAGRTITKVYTNNAAATSSQGKTGRFVVVELSPADKDAALFSGGPGGGGGRGGPGAGPGGAVPGGPGGVGGSPGGQSGPGSAPGGQANGGGGPRPPMGMGMASKKKPLKVSVAQVGAVTTVAGETYPGDAATFDSDKGVNEVVDDFKQFEFKDPVTGMTLAYNLYTPRNYDKKKSYPLVLFMPDASVTGAETTRPLTQGLGGVVWATPAEQAKHQAFVLAPAFASGAATEGVAGEATADTVVDLVNFVVSQNSVDTNRVYTTGQSFGCMLSLAIMIKHPNLFAASMLVAGQRDAQATAVLDHNKMWIIVAEGDTRAFPGMNDSVAVWEKEGTRVSKATWNARSSEAELTADAKKMEAEGDTIKYATFEKGTVFPVGQAGGIEHMATWPVAYRIEGVRDWLFAQTKMPGSK